MKTNDEIDALKGQLEATKRGNAKLELDSKCATNAWKRAWNWARRWKGAAKCWRSHAIDLRWQLDAAQMSRYADLQARVQEVADENAELRRQYAALDQFVGVPQAGMAQEIERMRVALVEIKDGRIPQMCPEFEICEHEGCRASYAAFAIAEQALDEYRKRKDGQG